MSADSDERLVARLVRDLRPVRRVAPLGLAVASALAAGAVVCTVAVSAWGVRADLVARLGELGRYGTVLAGLGGVALGGVLAGVASGRPDRGAAARAGELVALAGLAFGMLACAASCALAGDAWRAFDGGVPLASDLRCLARGLAVGTLPAIAAAVLAARGAPRRVVAAAALAGLGGVAMGAFAVHLVCPANAVRHVLVSHLGAPVAGALAALALAAGAGRWARAR